MPHEQFEKLQHEINHCQDDQQKLDLLIELVFQERLFDTRNAIKNCQRIIQLAQKLNNLPAEGRGYNHISVCQWMRGSYDEAMNSISKALDIAMDIRDTKLEARCYNNLGNVYREIGDFSNALKYYEKSININQNEDNIVHHADNLINIAIIYYELNDFEDSLNYVDEALSLLSCKKDEVRYTFSKAYNCLGNIYFKLDQLPKAKEYYLKSMENIAEETIPYYLSLTGLGKISYKEGEYNTALHKMQKSLNSLIKLGHLEGQIISYFYLAKVYFEQKNYQESIEAIKKSKRLAERHKKKPDLLSIYMFYAEYFETIQNYKSAYYYLKEADILGDELFQQKIYHQLSYMQNKHEVDVAKKEKELAEANAKLKQNFMANMSHEIRTPMNAILGMTELLIKHDPKPEQKRQLNAINTSAQNLLTIINDILDFSKIESGKIRIEQIPFSLSETLNNLYNTFKIKCDEKNIKLFKDMPSDLPNYYIGDPTRINQVLINLIGNSIKFTSHGGITFGIQEYNPHTSLCTFYVQDTGIGISPAYVNKIFESFSQAGTDMARKYGGTGLGLTISKELVNLMGGDISFITKDGEGTTFYFQIPLPQSDEIPVSDPFADEKKITTRLQTAQILIAEDNEFNRMLIEDTLKEWIKEPKIIFANNGKEAIEQIKNHQFDLIFMDIQMPEMDGEEATQIIRKYKLIDESTPVIAMTANALSEDAQRYLSNGFTDYISKPYRSYTVYKALKKNLKTLQWEEISNDDDTTLQPELVENAIKTDTYFNPSFLKTFTNDNREKQIKYINIFLKDAPVLLESIDTNWKQRQADNLKIAAHSLKSLLKYMGVAEKESHIFAIEEKAKKEELDNELESKINHLQNLMKKVFDEIRLYLVKLQSET